MNKGQAKKLKNRFPRNYFVRNNYWEGFVHVEERPNGDLALYETALLDKNAKTVVIGEVTQGSVFDEKHYTLTIDEADFFDYSAPAPLTVVERFLASYDAYVAVEDLVTFLENKYGRGTPRSY